jgi:osmotically-inducible protein OsmY
MRDNVPTTKSLSSTLDPYQSFENVNMKSDSQLQQDVKAELRWEPSVHGAQIGFAVKEGVATLCGHVKSYLEKWRADWRVTGVWNVKAIPLWGFEA